MLLFKTTNSHMSLAIFLSVWALISLFAVYKVRETRYLPKDIDKKIQESIREIACNILANGDSVEKVAAVTTLPENTVAVMQLQYHNRNKSL